MNVMSLTYASKNNCPFASKYFFMVMMVLWVARTTPLTSFKPAENPFLTPIYLGILAYYFVTYCKKNVSPLLIFIAIIVVWYACICIKYESVQPVNFTLLYSIIIVHIAYNIYNRNDFVELYEDVLVKFCILSLIVWGGSNIFPSVVPKLMHSIAVYENHPPTEANSIIVGMGSQFSMGIRRNIGFTWEPGRFSCFILFALYVNLIRSKFKIFPLHRNKKFFLLLITLLSTLSTTGYCAFGLIILFYVINASAISKTLAIVLTAFTLPSIIGLTFIGEKMMNLLDVEQEISAINYYYGKGMEVVCPQRFASHYFEYLNFIHDPLIGYNDISKAYINNSLFRGVLVTSSQGLIEVFSKFGFFVGSFFYYWLICSSVYMSKAYKYKGKYLFAILFLTVSVSYDFWENCIFMCFYLCDYYRRFSKWYFIQGRIPDC